MIASLEIKFEFDRNLIVNEEHISGFVVCVVVSYVICNIQCFLGLRSVQKSLLKLYRGQKINIALLSSNATISNGNTHFAGFLVGFLLNGFLFIFAFLFLIVLIIYYITQFSNWEQIKQIILKIVPIITVILVKFIFNFVCSRFIFLQEKSKVLALDNFRAYSVFIYITFFFDCFVGALSALIRLIIGLVGAIFFMPRIGYSFLGRQIENFDTGFKVSTGYYQMEYSHSHPVLLSFCALIYYKRLVAKFDKHHARDLVQIIKNRRKKNQVDSVDKLDLVEVNNSSSQSIKNNMYKKVYSQRVFNRWFVAYTLINNNNLIFLEKKHLLIGNLWFLMIYYL